MVMPTASEDTNVIEAINLMLGAAERLSTNPQHKILADTLVFFSSRLAGVDTNKTSGCKCGSGGCCSTKPEDKNSDYVPIVDDFYYTGKNQYVSRTRQETPNYPDGVVKTLHNDPHSPRTQPSTSTPTLMLLAPHTGVSSHRWMDKEARIEGPLKKLTSEEHAKCMDEIVDIINKVKAKLQSSK